MIRGACALLLAGALAAPTLRAQTGGIEIFAGETLFEQGTRLSLSEFYLRRSTLYRGTGEVSDPLDRTREEFWTVLGGDYGIARNVTLSALVPVVYQRFRSTGPTLETTGLGDAALLGKYRLYQSEGRGTAFNWALIGGLELPTGRTDAAFAGMRLPAQLQIGSGAWNPFIATSATADAHRFRFDGTVFFKYNTEGTQDFDPGEFLAIDLSASWRFLQWKYPGPTVAFGFGVQWRQQGRAEQNGQTVFDSGGDQLMASFRLNTHPVPSMDLGLRADVPMYQDLNGVQLGRDLALLLTFGFRF